MPEPRVYAARERNVAGSGRDFAAELNPEQFAAAAHGDGPLLSIAGAGTGKTRTLVYRVAPLLARGVRPERILLLTFTRRAAHEMLSRAERLVGPASTRVQGGTFHATGHRLLRQFGPQAGLARDFSIMDQGDAEDLIQLARASLGFGKKEKRFPKKETLHYIYSRHLNTEQPVDELLEREFPQFVEFSRDVIRIFAEYTSRKAERNLVDYDDLLLFWALMLEQSTEIAERIAGLYDHILVDEYQDTNLLQARILQGSCRDHRNITVVGDDAQSVYSFRGASVRNILDFPRQFPDTKVVTLEQNYRSTQPILDVTNTLISRAPERFTKNLWTVRTGTEAPWLVTTRDEQQQTRFVVDRILELHEEGTPLKEIAVLVRAGYMSADLEIELTNRKIPFEKWGGLKFLEAAHVKDVLAVLRFAENPRDRVAGFRVTQLVPGIGPASAARILDRLAAPDPAAMLVTYAPPRAGAEWHSFAALFDALFRRASGWPAELEQVRRWYQPHLERLHDDAAVRTADLAQLEQIAASYRTREQFLTDLTLDPPSATSDEAGAPLLDEDYLILSTIHSAKGQEWKSVFVLNAVDGCIPSDLATGNADEIEEERRLLYVALTRAKDQLDVIVPQRFYTHNQANRGDRYVHALRTRFIPTPVSRLFEQRVWPSASQGAASATPQSKVDVTARMRAMWR